MMMMMFRQQRLFLVSRRDNKTKKMRADGTKTSTKYSVAWRRAA